MFALRVVGVHWPVEHLFVDKTVESLGPVAAGFAGTEHVVSVQCFVVVTTVVAFVVVVAAAFAAVIAVAPAGPAVVPGLVVVPAVSAPVRQLAASRRLLAAFSGPLAFSVPLYPVRVSRAFPAQCDPDHPLPSVPVPVAAPVVALPDLPTFAVADGVLPSDAAPAPADPAPLEHLQTVEPAAWSAPVSLTRQVFVKTLARYLARCDLTLECVVLTAACGVYRRYEAIGHESLSLALLPAAACLPPCSN